MPRTIAFDGRTIQVPDDFSDDEVNKVLATSPAQAPSPQEQQANALRQSVAYGATQNPDQYAKLLDLQKHTGLGPAITQDRQPQIQQTVDTNSIDYPSFAVSHPRTTAWASNPDNAAVAGVSEIQRLAGIEASAGEMRAATPWESFQATTIQPAFRALMGYPLTRMGIDAVAGTSGMVGNIASRFGVHGDGATNQNLLQRIEAGLNPSQTGGYINGVPDKDNGMDWLAKNVAPMIPAVMASGGVSLLARTLGLSTTAAKVLAGLTVGGMFTADQAGKTYTAAKASGASDNEALRAENQVTAINAIPNALFGATDVVPYMRDNPLATALGLGGATGAAGQVSQNVVTGKPALQGTLSAALQGMAMQGGMHLGSEAFFGNLAGAIDATQQSKLRQIAGDKFHEALQEVFAGDASLQIPADRFTSYFKDKGMDPGKVASALGSTNYAEAVMSDNHVDIPKEDFLGKLDPEHQAGLFPDIVDPVSGLTLRQHQEGRDELQQFATGGGAEQLLKDTASADAETAASPEYLAVKEQLRQRYVNAGDSPGIAETTATKDANAYSNLARNAGMKPTELLDLYNPKVTMGEAPGITANVDEPPRVDFGEALTRYIEADPEGAIAKYSRLENTDGGRILNTDEARELSEHYRDDRTRSADVHEPASQFIKDLYAKKLNEPVAENRDPLVLFTAGGTGAGKSSALRTPEGKALQTRADIVYDTNMNNVASSEKKIQQALDSGRNVAIMYTYRDPVEALTGGALPRAMKMGRTVPLEDHLGSHVGSRAAMDMLQAKYADDPRVEFSGIDNSLGKGKQEAKSIDSMPAVEENGLRERLQNALESEHSAGRISDAVRNGTAGARRDVQGENKHANLTGNAERPAVQPSAGDAGSSRQPEAQDAEPLTPRNFPTVTTPDELKPYDVARVPVDQLHLNPSRFQYKMNVDATGVTNLLKGRNWNEDLAGVISVWRDPADGKTYVVNGHHRFQLAKETGQPNVAVRMIAADDAAEARAKGAIQNIAEGRGTAMDAAKFFRDSGHTPADLDRLGVSMGEKTASDGLALARLHPGLFDQVVNGKVAEGRAVAIGNATADPADQEAILKLIDKTEAKGKHVTNDTVNELARMVKGAGQHTETQDSLFGAVEQTHSLVLEKAEVSSYIRKEISTEQRTFASVSDEKKAAKLGTVKGQTIDAAANSEIADKAAIAKELYDRLSVRSGTVDDILNRASRELAEGGKPNDVKASAYADTRDALREALSGADRINSGVVGENQGGPAAGESADAATASDLLEVFHQAKKRQASSGDTGAMFAGMEPYAAEREQAEANLQRQAMEDRLRSPKGDISKAAGDWERNSPLGFGSGENPSLFGDSDSGENPSLFQSNGDGARGWFRVLPDGSYEIGRTKIGDLSTFVHEPAHAYLKIIGDLSKRDGASDILKDDYQKILDFLGVKDGEPFTREQQETWARANEQYLREGNAPSPGLKGTFQRFGIWLHSIYQKASDLGVGLTDEIRGVMDRLYASEEGVNRAEQEAGPKLFNSAEEAGWTDEQFKNYADAKGMEVDQAKTEILSKLNEAALRDKTEDWRREEKNVREAVTSEIDQRPEYAAIRALRKGELDDGTPLTMNRDELVKQFGEDRVKELQKQHPGLYRNDGGVDPETAAESLGYTSAGDMMRALEAAPRRSAKVEQETQEYMTGKHGDIRYDGTLYDQARIALENDKKSDGLYKELKALRQKLDDLKAQATGQKEVMKAINIAPLSSYREAAQQMIESKTPADLQPSRYLDASRKYSREAFDGLRKGDVDAAVQAKHKELLNHFLYREAMKAQDYLGKFESYGKRMQTPGPQGKLGLAGSDYRDQFNYLMGRYNLGRPAAAAPGRTLADWAMALHADGKEPAIDPAILNEKPNQNYRTVPIAEVRKVHDALINIRKLADQELGIEVNGKKIEFAAAVNDMSERAKQSLTVKPTRVLIGNATVGERLTNFAQRGDALLLRAERIMEWLDGGKDGPWHDNLWHLASDAQGDEYALQEAVTKRIGDALEAMPKEQRMKMLDKVDIDGIPETVTRHDLVSMALNMGNQGNLERLERTFQVHGWDTGSLWKIQESLSREEWQFVQDTWDSLKPLGDRMVELEQRLTGLPPVMVKPTPLSVKMADGTEMNLSGGYYPVAMDPRFSTRGAVQDAGDTAQNLMEAGYGRAATSRGYTKGRTGFGGPLLLDYEQVLTQHTAKVIKDISHREFMLVANKLLLDPTVRQTMRETLGAGHEEQMMPWLRTIINDRNGSATQGLGDFSRTMRALRTNLTLASLTYKVSTSLLQWTHAPRMMLLTKPGSFSQAMVDFMAHPQDMTAEIQALSPNEMRFRGQNLDRDVRSTMQAQIGKTGLYKAAVSAGSLSMKYTDHVLSFPLWLSVYRDALNEHVDLPEDQAKYKAMQAADSAVRLGLGSGSPKDLPPIMRNNDLSKFLTMFYSFHNGIYGQVRDIAHQTNGMRDVPKMTYGLALSVLVPAVLSKLVLGQGPKDGENWGSWAAKRSLLFGMDTMPILRDVASALDSNGDVKFNPLMNVFSKGAKASMQAMSDKADKDWTGIGLNTLETAMDLTGVPGTTQAMKPLHYMDRVEQGRVSNPNIWDAVVGSVSH